MSYRAERKNMLRAVRCLDSDTVERLAPQHFVSGIDLACSMNDPVRLALFNDDKYRFCVISDAYKHGHPELVEIKTDEDKKRAFIGACEGGQRKLAKRYLKDVDKKCKLECLFSAIRYNRLNIVKLLEVGRNIDWSMALGWVNHIRMAIYILKKGTTDYWQFHRAPADVIEFVNKTKGVDVKKEYTKFISDKTRYNYYYAVRGLYR